MSKLEFLYILYNNIYDYIYICTVTIFVYYFIFKRYIYNIIDPFVFFFIATFSFSAADIIFLYELGYIKLYYLVQFFLTQVLFVLGYYMFKPYQKIYSNIPKKVLTKDMLSFEKIKILFYITSSIYILSRLLVYKISGIPLLMDSRFEAFSGGGGIGIFSRLIDVVSFVATFILFLNIFYKKIRFLHTFTMLLLLLLFTAFNIFTGSKMAILTMIYIGFYAYLSGNIIPLLNQKIGRKIKKYLYLGIILAFFGAIMILVIQYNTQEQGKDLLNLEVKKEVYLGVFTRFIMNGDIYIMAYPNNTIEKMVKPDPFTILLSSIFYSIRLMSREDKIPELGQQLYYYHNPKSDLLMGPTTHFDIFSYFNYGYFGSLIFSFLSGLFLSFVINKSLQLFKKNLFYLTIYSLIAYTILYFPLNPIIGIGKLFNILIFLPFLIMVTNFIDMHRRKKYVT